MTMPLATWLAAVIRLRAENRRTTNSSARCSRKLSPETIPLKSLLAELSKKFKRNFFAEFLAAHGNAKSVAYTCALPKPAKMPEVDSRVYRLQEILNSLESKLGPMQKFNYNRAFKAHEMKSALELDKI